MEIASIKGFRDILPEETRVWQWIETTARRVFEDFGFQEIKTPILEKTELFSRSIGEETDIVSKEMYTFDDVKGRSLTLRPEATASVVRAYIQNRPYQTYPVQKLYSIGPMFRHERPQRGRFRQFHQINAELFGDPGPKSDADMISMAVYLFRSIGLDDVALNLNSLGCSDCRPRFKEALTDYLADKVTRLCEDCQRRATSNPLRVFDCKVDSCKEVVSKAPSIDAFLCQACRDHFESVQDALSDLEIPFVLNSRLVRGLDYYNRTTFEIQTERLGAQNAVAGGGRYDGLVRLLGGPDHPAIGFAVGVERVVALIGDDHPLQDRRPDLFIAALGKAAERAAFKWAVDLRRNGLWVEVDYASTGLKSQMKKADRIGARHVLIVGEDELKTSRAALRNMLTKEQADVELKDAVNVLKEMLKDERERDGRD
ncbi:MAG: histidyl-tRNA synthetase [Thermodesulfobacteriota bacterium]|nr:histidyl-tRNA synthetase [Thermodesulfobacteriota bacterium]